MAAPARPLALFPEPLPLAVRLADLRRQGVLNERTQVAHNRKPSGTKMRDLGHRRSRRRARNRMRGIVAALT